MKLLKKALVLMTLTYLLTLASAHAQGSPFTYQGKLTDSSFAPTATYEMQFSLYDAVADGTQISTTNVINNVSVVNGIFTVRLTFGVPAFDGNPRFLEIAVRRTGDPSPHTILGPRQPVRSAPYAIRALNAGSADLATNSNQLGGTPANQYVITEDLRLSDSRSPLAGSSNYVQNTTTTQAASNFNISGTGTANAFDAASQFNIGGNRTLSSGGTNNLFAGANSASVNTTGQSNAFFGAWAGSLNTTGSFNTFAGPEAGLSNLSANANSFFGSAAGRQTWIGSGNSFFGADAGRLNSAGDNNAFFGTFSGLNSTNGSANTFVGGNAGLANVTGNNNTIVGNAANLGANNLTFATALGSGAVVSTNNTVVLGRAFDTVQVPGSLTIAGTFSANILNAGTHFSIAGTRMLSAGGTNNIFAGNGAGTVNSTGQANSFVGFNAGNDNTTGSFNAFFGSNAGAANTTAINNSFFGQGAGFKNTTASDNTFIGNGSGLNNTTGAGNTFVGSLAGKSTVGGGNNTFLGVNAGLSNFGNSNNTFVGANTANSVLPGSGNTYIGTNTDGAVITNNSTAIGFNAYAGQSNSVILGSVSGINGATATTDVGIGTSTPESRLHVVGDTSLIGNVGIGTTSPSTLVHIKGATAAPLIVEGTSGAGAAINLHNSTANNADWNIAALGTFESNVLSIKDNTHNAEVMEIKGQVPSGFGPSVKVRGYLFTEYMSVNLLGGAGSETLCRNGNAFISTCSSSLRYKKDMQPYNMGLSLLNQLNPISFRWKSNSMLDLGFGAEDVAKVEPLLVTHNDKGEIEGVKYDRISAVLVNAVKEQQAQIERQEKLITLLTEQLAEVKKLAVRRSKATRNGRFEGPEVNRRNGNAHN